MYGISFYSIWVEKYGEKEANIRYEKWRENKKNISDETREKMKKSNSGRKASDKTKKLQSEKRKGELNPACKIKDSEIPKILIMIKNGISVEKISDLYNVSKITIYNIKKGKRKFEMK